MQSTIGTASAAGTQESIFRGDKPRNRDPPLRLHVLYSLRVAGNYRVVKERLRWDDN